ncbi:DNA-directed RNA polymerase II subunit RPB9 isoform X1 [Poecilia latipinna]|uniref:DNA-directed RNA polymerase II subunit RPB9 isoform X1 n=1 Tax=Poecilia formosa TaxID=48698 RepID=UPI00044403BC|nr:PREDICTED: DNA-directed RNA polymerase II subunit RPB9 isoform X1 [Poecilia formosa]XP_008424148.1 PREDICTED: DNA-directed RNA polymerase II subunit RPB9 isoform X1 [Poecilia reticulata]XP_014837969.1 PREDICTED: DNA-directed RNA polymerase II subunit RPB9 isoform X1 [Poecilia mexicana]XP_014884070.1 PREDICTED: DNA-directed RNA polymerase II subunit RPB9 isoform X1 [Poecilia latipinna]
MDLEGGTYEPGFVGIRFCQECNNMLYPKEDKENRILLYACRNCDYQQEADNSCIYVNKITHEVDELTQIIADVAQDPTLPRTEDHPCPKCGHKEAVFFQSHSMKAEVRIPLKGGIYDLSVVVPHWMLLTYFELI